VEEVLTPLFPRYVFIGMDQENAKWRSISGTRGVSYLLMADDYCPAQVPISVLEELRAREISDGIVPIAGLITFAKGDKIRILEGSFKDQVAVFESLDDKGRVQLLMSFLGREAKISLPAYAVDAA
jgi:transcriptional antiterminator RfaH